MTTLQASKTVTVRGGIPLVYTTLWKSAYAEKFFSAILSRKNIPASGALFEFIASSDDGKTYQVVDSIVVTQYQKAGCLLESRASVGFGWPKDQAPTNIGLRMNCDADFMPDISLKVD